MDEIVYDDLSTVILDDHNLNEGTMRGEHLLTQSITTLGLGRGGFADGNRVMMGGNKTVSAAIASNLTKAIFVKSDGSQLIAVRRKDVSIKSEMGQLLKLADNRTHEINYAVSNEELLYHIEKGLDLTPYFTEEELVAIIGEIQPETDEPKKGGGATSKDKSFHLEFTSQEYFFVTTELAKLAATPEEAIIKLCLT